jgi:hypothetical protein
VVALACAHRKSLLQPGMRTCGQTGEALYMDLGQGRLPLVALMTKPRRSQLTTEFFPEWAHDGQGPIRVLRHVYDLEDMQRKYAKDHRGENSDTSRPAAAFFEMFAILMQQRKPRTLSFDMLPDLVTFADVSNPKTVRWVDPRNLERDIGTGVQLKRATIQITEEPVTSGLFERLPWLRALRIYLDGGTMGSPPMKYENPSRTLSKEDFYAEGW